MTDYIVPVLLFLLCAIAIGRRENAFHLMLDGAGEGLRLTLSLIPTLVLLLTCVTMLRASGAIDALSRVFAPVFHAFGVPPETAALILVRPISGSAALAVGTELMATYGPDSQIGRTVSIMLGSTETTFYVISIYFGSAGIRKTRYAIPAALIADITGFLVASLVARIL